MKPRRSVTILLALALPVFLAQGCGDSPTDVLSPAGADAAKGGTKGKPGGGDGGGGDDGGKSTVLVADLVRGDFAAAGGAPWLSAGSAEVSSAGGVLFKHTRCGDVTPEGSSYALTDENRMEIRSKGRTITGVRFWGQDVIGDAGVAHETDWIDVTASKRDIGPGYVLHVHAENVPVWRLDGHLGGNRVAVIGTLSIGDVRYSDGAVAVCEGGTL